MEQVLANNLFPVYLSLQAIHKDKAFLQKRSVITLAPHLSTAVFSSLFCLIAVNPTSLSDEVSTPSSTPSFHALSMSTHDFKVVGGRYVLCSWPIIAGYWLL